MKDRIQKLIEQYYAAHSIDLQKQPISAEELAEFIDNGIRTHMCDCGNIVDGYDEDELCDECKRLYGHSFGREL